MNDQLSYAAIGKAMEVHRELGPGLDERFYHELLSRKLTASGLEHLSRPRRELMHRGLLADVFEADLVFEHRLIAELKCLTGGFGGEHFLQLVCYLKFWRIRAGLLFDFGKESLSHRRVEFTEPQYEAPGLDLLLAELPNADANKSAAQVGEAVRAVIHGYGLGYRDTTYVGLLLAELGANQAESTFNNIADVCGGGALLGQTACPCLLVNKQIAVRVLALRRSITAADVAVVRTYLKLLNASCGLILNFNRTELNFRWVGCKWNQNAQ